MTIDSKLMSHDELAECQQLATRVVTQLDGFHGDPARWGNWIGHRDYAQKCLRLLAHVAAQDARVAQLETALRDAVEHWRYPPLTTAEKARKDEIWSLVNPAP